MTLHDSHLSRLFEPALRSYAVTAAASLFAIFAVQFDSGSVAAAGVPVLCGVAGLLLRWTAMPVALVATLAYFLFFPIGLPVGLGPRTLLRESHFNLDDLVLAAAVLVYLAAQYRIFDLTHPAANAQAETARPASSIEESELLRSLGAVATVVIVGQALWWLVANREFHLGDDSPLRGVPRFRRAVDTALSAELNRFVMLVLITAIVAGLARFAFWYLRLAKLKPDEARLILIDTHWQENRRELARLETWRSWRLGHDRSRRGNADRVFRGIVRAIFVAIFAGFLAWILYFNYIFH